jgi:hypothetical protein
MSGETAGRIFPIVEEIPLRLAQHGLSQYNESVNRHGLAGGRLSAYEEIGRHAMCEQVSVRTWSVPARAKLRGRSCLAWVRREPVMPTQDR